MIIQTSYEGGDENLFRSSWDAQYQTTTEEKFSGNQSLKLEPEVGQQYGDFGPNIREYVHTGDTVNIDIKTLWYGTSSQRGGGVAYALIDENGNYLWESSQGSNGYSVWREITLSPLAGDYPSNPTDHDTIKWHDNGVNDWVIPDVFDANGAAYTGKVTLQIVPWASNGSNATYFDDLRVEIQRAGETDEYFEAVIVSSSDYGAWGDRLKGRGFSTMGSKFGYQGSLHDDEVAGEGNFIYCDYRALDTRLGRWFSVDPVFQPWQSPYTSMDNNPINLNDPAGSQTAPAGKVTKRVDASVNASHIEGNRIIRRYTEKGKSYVTTIDQKGVTRTYRVGSVSGGMGQVNPNVTYSQVGGPAAEQVKSSTSATPPKKIKQQVIKTSPPPAEDTDWWDIAATVAEVAIGFTPVGTLMDVYDLSKAIASGDPKEMAMAAVGFIPGGDIIKGAKKILKHADEGATAAKKAAEVAKTVANAPVKVNIPPVVVTNADNVVAEVKQVEKTVVKQSDQAVDQGTKKAEEVIPTGNMQWSDYQGTIRNKKLAGDLHPKTEVPFDVHGFPDFSAHLYKGGLNDVHIKPTGSRAADEAAANLEAGYDATPAGYTWHHHQEMGRMQLVESKVHNSTGHTGGYSIYK